MAAHPRRRLRRGVGPQRRRSTVSPETHDSAVGRRGLMSGPYGNDPYGASQGAGDGMNGPDPTRQFPQAGGGYPAPPVYGPPATAPPGPGGPPKRNLGPWLGGAAAVAVLLVVGLILFFTLGNHSDTPTAAGTTSATTAAPSTTTSVRATAVPPLPSSLATVSPGPTSPRPTSPRPTSARPTSARPTPSTRTAAPTSGAALIPANPDQVEQITTLAKALVDGISKGDMPAIARITCGTLASSLGSGASEPDPTVYDHVDNIKVSPDGSAGSVDVFAYTVKSGPPADAVTFILQKQGAAWKACDISQ